jgi:hypothetical protein
MSVHRAGFYASHGSRSEATGPRKPRRTPLLQKKRNNQAVTEHFDAYAGSLARRSGLLARLPGLWPRQQSALARRGSFGTWAIHLNEGAEAGQPAVRGPPRLAELSWHDDHLSHNEE